MIDIVFVTKHINSFNTPKLKIKGNIPKYTKVSTNLLLWKSCGDA